MLSIDTIQALGQAGPLCPRCCRRVDAAEETEEEAPPIIKSKEPNGTHVGTNGLKSKAEQVTNENGNHPLDEAGDGAPAENLPPASVDSNEDEDEMQANRQAPPRPVTYYDSGRTGAPNHPPRALTPGHHTSHPVPPLSYVTGPEPCPRADRG
jgi:hypothetical protein